MGQGSSRNTPCCRRGISVGAHSREKLLLEGHKERRDGSSVKAKGCCHTTATDLMGAGGDVLASQQSRMIDLIHCRSQKLMLSPSCQHIIPGKGS